MWMPVDPVPRASILELVGGSHRGAWYMPRTFLDDEARWFPEGTLTELPDIDGEPRPTSRPRWELEPGDAVFFHMLTLHASRVCPARSASSAVDALPRRRRRARTRAWATSPPFPGLGRRAPRRRAHGPPAVPRALGQAVTVRPIATVGHPSCGSRPGRSPRASWRRRDPDADRRPHRHDARRQRRRHRRQPGPRARTGSAVIEVDHNPRYPYKPPIPLTVVVNPVIEPLDDELVEINEGCLSVPDLRATCSATSTCGSATSTATASPTTRSSAA